jgi:propane monooxygenase small subunit
MQAAALQGDFVTPTIMGCGEADTAREQRGARALFRMLADDPEHGAANKALMQQWLDEWVPVSLEAAHQLQPIWSQVSEKVVRFDDSLSRSKSRMTDLLEDLTLDTPKEIRA